MTEKRYTVSWAPAEPRDEPEKALTQSATFGYAPSAYKLRDMLADAGYLVTIETTTVH